MTRWTPNRIVAMGTGAVGVLLALASLATASGGPQAAGVAAGAVVVLGVADRWLRGWQAWEARQGEADDPIGMDDLADVLAVVAEREPEADTPVPVHPEHVPEAERGAP